MRLVAVQTGLSPLSVLGGTITDREFLTRLADRGVEVHVMAEDGEPIITHTNIIPHYWKRRLKKKLPYIGNMDVALDLHHLLGELGSVDWIRFNSPYSVGIGTVVSGKGHRIWASYLHCEDRPFFRLVDKWLPRYCDLITCLSEDTRRDIISRCPPADNAHTIITPMGIDLRRFENIRRSRADVRRELRLADDDVLTLFVGVLTPRKGISDLIAAWRLVKPDPKNKLLFISKPVMPYETGLVAELVGQDNRVTHLPKVPYEQIPEYFQAGDIFLFPTHLEGFGIVVGEAMACGLPVVTTRAKGVREVVAENETALVADVGQPAQLAAHLETLLKDRALRHRMGLAGKERIRKSFQWDGIIDTLMRSLQN